jgi:GTP-binding protein HflX
MSAGHRIESMANLVEQAEAAAQKAAPRRSGEPERAVLVAVEFAMKRGGRLSTSVRQARLAGLARTGTLDDGDEGTRPGVSPRAEASGADFDAALEEFAELARSAGAQVSRLLIQRRQRPDPATLVGAGKLDEIRDAVSAVAADLVLFDHDLTPSQLRNLDAALPCRVLDRTQLILDIFAHHARTREGHLQVELAQLEYQLPRLAGRGKSMSQLGGGIGTRGPGETQLETDRRRINLRIDHLKQQIESVRRIRRQQRQRREAVPVPTVALIGYTNAGKSTLFNALTHAGVLESARMFATLDPKLRQLQMPSRRQVLLSDTVGFIRNLPHSLITSFRATLEEVERAEVLLHVRDATSPVSDEQKAQVQQVLAELGIGKARIIEVWNKSDLLDADARAELETGDHALLVSAKTGEGISELLAAVDRELQVDPLQTSVFRLPQSKGAAVAALERGARIERRWFAGNLVYLEVAGPASLLARYGRYRVAEGESGTEPPEFQPRMRPRSLIAQSVR